MDVAGRYWITLTRDLYICTPVPLQTRNIFNFSYIYMFGITLCYLLNDEYGIFKKVIPFSFVKIRRRLQTITCSTPSMADGAKDTTQQIGHRRPLLCTRHYFWDLLNRWLSIIVRLHPCTSCSTHKSLKMSTTCPSRRNRKLKPNETKP